MFVLLEQLRRARRTAALDRSGAIGSCALRHVDCGSCNACEHELTATLGPGRGPGQRCGEQDARRKP